MPMTCALADHGSLGCIALEGYLLKSSSAWAVEEVQDAVFCFKDLFLLDQQALTASVQQASAPPCLARPARKLRSAALQQQPNSSHAKPAPPLPQQQQHVQQEPSCAGQEQQLQQCMQACAGQQPALSAAADAAGAATCKPAAQGEPAAACGSSSSEVLQELHRLRVTKFCQAAGPLMLGIVACLLVLALLPQLQQTLAGSSGSSSRGRRCSNGKCQLLVQLLPGLAAVAVSQLRPLQFRTAQLERGFQGCAVRSKRAIDLFLSSLWCLLVLCTSLRVSWQTAAASVAAGRVTVTDSAPGADEQSSPCWCLLGFCRAPAAYQGCAAAAAPWTLVVPPAVLLLLLPMAALLLVALKAPNRKYLTLREPLHVLSRLAMISSGLHAASQPAGSGLLLLTLLHALTVACTMLRFSAFIPMQLMQTVALLLCTRGAALLPGMQLIAAGLVVPCIIVLQVEAAARQAFLSGGLTASEAAAAGGNALPAGVHSAKRLGFWGSSMQPVPVAKAAAAQPGYCAASGGAAEGGEVGSTAGAASGCAVEGSTTGGC